MINRLKLNSIKIAVAPRDLMNWLGYFLFFVFCFILFAYWTFPYERARSYLLERFNQQTLPGGRVKPSDLQLKIDKLEPSWFTGVEMTGVELIKQATQADDQPMVISADYAMLRTSIFALIFGEIDLLFEVGVGPGEIKGSYKREENEQEILAGIEAIDMSRLGIDGIIGLPVKGRADGAVTLSIGKESAKTRGNINFKVSKLVIGDGKSKLKLATLRDGITIDTINAGDLKLNLKVEKGVGTIAEFSSFGKDIQLSGSGSIRFAGQLKLSRLDLTLDLVFTNAYKNKSERTRTLFSLLNLHPSLQNAKTNDGSLRYQITGTLGSPRYRPAGRSYSATISRMKRNTRKR
ncbi:MAG: type II secretion system protein GspN [Deltaproteobacteria bacterium]|nr:type II secretion system protein GspN [Deltaproteobacteria bacterium]